MIKYYTFLKNKIILLLLFIYNNACDIIKLCLYNVNYSYIQIIYIINNNYIITFYLSLLDLLFVY